MARVLVPSLMRDLTAGRPVVSAEGDTVADVVASLDAAYPGFAARILHRGQLDPALVLIVEGRVAPLGLRTRLDDTSELRFVPAVGGG